MLAVTLGLLAGGIAASWTAGALRRELFALTTTEPLVWTATALVILAAASLGAIIPAMRAGTVDPVTALRVE